MIIVVKVIIMYISNIYLLAKTETQEILIQTVRIYAKDIRMELIIEKCAMKIIRTGNDK